MGREERAAIVFLGLVMLVGCSSPKSGGGDLELPPGKAEADLMAFAKAIVKAVKDNDPNAYLGFVEDKDRERQLNRLEEFTREALVKNLDLRNMTIGDAVCRTWNEDKGGECFVAVSSQNKKFTIKVDDSTLSPAGWKLHASLHLRDADEFAREKSKSYFQRREEKLGPNEPVCQELVDKTLPQSAIERYQAVVAGAARLASETTEDKIALLKKVTDYCQCNLGGPDGLVKKLEQEIGTAPKDKISKWLEVVMGGHETPDSLDALLRAARKKAGDAKATTKELEYTLRGYYESSERCLKRHWGDAKGKLFWRLAQRIPSSTDKNLTDLWGASADDVWVVGEKGTILHWNGKGFNQTPSNTTSDLNDVWGASASDVWAVGNDGVIVHWNGASWSAVSSGTNFHLQALWGASPSDVWAVGSNGTTLHWDGANWKDVYSGHGLVRFSVWGTGSNDVWNVGERGAVLHWNGQKQKMNVTPPRPEFMKNMYGLAGTGPSDVWAVGADGNGLHFDGRTWQAMNVGSGGTLRDISNIDGGLFAVGWGSTIVDVSGRESFIGGGDQYELNGVWGGKDAGMWVVGNGGTVLRFDMPSGLGGSRAAARLARQRGSSPGNAAQGASSAPSSGPAAAVALRPPEVPAPGAVKSLSADLNSPEMQAALKAALQAAADGAVGQPPQPQVAPPGEPGKLKPDSVVASSAYPKNPAAHAFDGDPATAWNEKAEGSGEGEWIEARFDRPVRLDRIRLATGWDYVSPKHGDLFRKNARIKRYKVELDGGRVLEGTAAESDHSSELSGIGAVTTKVRITIAQAYRGDKWQDLCISEVELMGSPQ